MAINTTIPAAAPAVPQKPKHILVIGGAYCGISTIITLQYILSGGAHRPGPYNLPELSRLPTTPRITLLDERDGVYHTVGTPLFHTSPDVADIAPKAWKLFSGIPFLKDVTVVRGRAESIDPARKQAVYTGIDGAAGGVIPYDYVVCATGLKRAWPVQPRAVSKTEFLRDARELVKGLVDAQERIVVVGGGAVGTEFAGELKLTQPGKRITLIHSREKLLSAEPLPEEFKERTLQILEEDGVEVMLNTRVLNEVGSKLELSTGETIETSAVIWCVGRQHPSTGYIPEAALDSASGLVKINPNLTFPAEMPNAGCHFAAGDITKWSGIKRVGTAMIMGAFTATNLLLSILNAEGLEQSKLAELPEVVPMLVLALGKRAVGYHPAYGLSHGVEPLLQSFGDDKALTICFRCLDIPLDEVVKEVTLDVIGEEKN